MDGHQQAALNEVLRVNARLSAAMSSKDQAEKAAAPALRDELECARVVLAIERGLAKYVKNGGRSELTDDQVAVAIRHLQNRQGTR